MKGVLYFLRNPIVDSSTIKEILVSYRYLSGRFIPRLPKLNLSLSFRHVQLKKFSQLFPSGIYRNMPTSTTLSCEYFLSHENLLEEPILSIQNAEVEQLPFAVVHLL